PTMAQETPPDHEQRLRDSLAARSRIKAHFVDWLVKEGSKFPDASVQYSDAYIRIGDVEKAWSSEGTIERALYPNVLESTHITLIQENLLSYIFREDGSLLCANEDMPLQQDAMSCFRDRAFEMRFYHEQFMFSPAVIHESSLPIIIDANRRLPFEAYSTTSEEAGFSNAFQVYNFDNIFDRHSQHFMRDTYKQIANIAAALRWLHRDVRPLNKKMYFAHLDLKPDNILVDNDSTDHPSAVGNWVLTDFGISAFKETDEHDGQEYGTVRDYVEQKQNLTLNTHARREMD
ncbi:hypothetical protein N0V87_009482, partial [Didymella glomerata]